MQFDRPICFDCKHYRGDGICEAFPDRIPERILWGEIDHDKPLKGQKNDLVYEPIEGRVED